MDAYVTVLDLTSDAVLHRFGPFQNAAAARVAAAAKAGRALTWRKDGDLWRADLAPHAYLVPADPPAGQE
ncbi:hypothetical protein [Deinococcus soli (ex Cha et al. 2016)]|uniref:Uncharacterized protein n=1 Tax=Deinococcus soli (ex Cha et al. 2016) TaxID=1309411 RepID=A0ACC6KN36_9DEIO|nr:hypothetical protein [Deinococcus soli (ex Cha et al. 2016)]MDR6753820.1 hypothetical protein [Deinococcus soli (ex Cha et al. 2016)]